MGIDQDKEMHWKAFILLLKKIADKKKISESKIAELTGYNRSTINRVFKLEFCPKLQIFLDIARVLEINFFLTDKDDKTDLNVLFEKSMDELGRR